MQDLNLNWRYAVKEFDSSLKLSAEQEASLLDALRMAPSSFGLQLWKFAVVKSDETKKKIREAAWNQPKITQAPLLLVLCRKKTVDESDIEGFISTLAKERSIERTALKGYEDVIKGFVGQMPVSERHNWTARQTYVALGFLLATAAINKIDSCPVEGFEPAKVDKILGIDGSEYGSVVMCALGHRSQNDAFAGLKKVRRKSDEIISFY